MAPVTGRPRPHRPPATDGERLVAALRRALRQRLDRVRAFNRRALRRSEPVHQWRLALQRLLPAMDLARWLSATPPSPQLRDDLDWLHRRLGPLRDLDILTAALRQERAPAALLRPLAEQRQRLLNKVEASLQTLRYQRLRRRLHQLRRQLAMNTAVADTDALQRRLAATLQKRRRKLLARLASRRSPSRRRLHRIRLRVKKLRYQLELLTTTDRGDAARRGVAALKTAQQKLGKIQDRYARRRLIRDWARASPAAMRSTLRGLARGRTPDRRQRRHALQVATEAVGDVDALWTLQ